MGRRDLVALLVAVAVPLAVGALGSLATSAGVDAWYPTLRRPAWTPPSWVFAPVWTLLYVAMGVAAWLVWRRGIQRPLVRAGLAAFAVQLALNLAWPALFFGLRSPGWALLDIIALWAAIAVTMALFLRASLLAGLLLVPYLAWVTYALALNAAIWAMAR